MALAAKPHAISGREVRSMTERNSGGRHRSDERGSVK
jgi:hypothetical protein